MRIRRIEIRILLAVIALSVAFAMIPRPDNRVYAQTKNPEYLGPAELGIDYNTASATVVYFGGKEWKVIGYDGNGIACEKGEVVLFANEILTTCSYNNNVDDEYSKEALTYKGSTLQTTIDSFVEDNFTPGEKQSIIPRQLEAMNIPAYYVDYEYWWWDNFKTIDAVPYEGVTALSWPLSAKEAAAVNKFLLPKDSSYWLRTLGCVESFDDECGMLPPVMAIVSKDGKVTMQDEFFEDVTSSCGVRTALKLNPDNILFITPVTQRERKLTLKDEAHKNFSVNDCENTIDSNGDLVVKYQNAVSGDNEYISYIIERSDGYITKYQQCSKVTSASGTAAITGLPKDAEGKIALDEGDKLYIFNEQLNDEDKTDYSSSLIEIGTTTGHDWRFDKFTWWHVPVTDKYVAQANYYCARHNEHKMGIDANVEPGDNSPRC